MSPVKASADASGLPKLGDKRSVLPVLDCWATLPGRAGAEAMSQAEPSSERGSIALLLGLLAVSTSGPFFIMAKMSAFSAVFWRTALAGLIAITVARVRGSLQSHVLREHSR